MLLFLEKDVADEDNSLRQYVTEERPISLLGIDNDMSENHLRFSNQNTKESVARFINAMASIKTGRDYICKFNVK